MLKRYPLVIVMLLAACGLHAQPTIIGINYLNPIPITVVRWEAGTGNLLNSVATTQPASVMSSSAYDAYNGNYYFDGSEKIGRASFFPQSFTELTTSAIGMGTEIDMSNGSLFSIRTSYVYTPQGVFVSALAEFVRYNIATGTDTVLGTFPTINGFYGDANCFNSNAGIYYHLAIDDQNRNVLISIPTRTPGFTPTIIPMPVTATGIFTLEYDNSNDVIYALADNGSTGSNLKVLQIDPQTGSWTVEADFPQLIGYQSTTTSYDQATSSMVMVAFDNTGQFQLYNYSTTTNVLSTLMFPFAGQFGELECDNAVFAAARYGSSTSIQDELSKKRLVFFPNPANEYLQVVGDEMPVEVQLTDVWGRTSAVSLTGSSIDVSRLAPGIYFLRSRLSDGAIEQSTFVKQ